MGRTRIVVDAILSANGSGGHAAGGGSGGGILLEAPEVSVPGNVVANGGAGGCEAPDGNLDATPAPGGECAGDEGTVIGDGGDGAAASATASR